MKISHCFTIEYYFQLVNTSLNEAQNISIDKEIYAHKQRHVLCQKSSLKTIDTERMKSRQGRLEGKRNDDYHHLCEALTTLTLKFVLEICRSREQLNFEKVNFGNNRYSICSLVSHILKKILFYLEF